MLVAKMKLDFWTPTRLDARLVLPDNQKGESVSSLDARRRLTFQPWAPGLARALLTSISRDLLRFIRVRRSLSSMVPLQR